MILRSMVPRTDLPQLLMIEQETQVAPWSEEVFNRCFTAGSLGWVAEQSTELLGFILLIIQVGEAHILNLCVRPNYQHQGIGQQLMAQALTEAKQQSVGIAYLEVRISNHKAINLYKKLGFMQVGERPDYYVFPEGRENALVFAKDLGTQ